MSGQYARHQVKPTDLIRFPDEETPEEKFDVEKRRQEAEETFRLHKQKFWTKIKGAKLEDVKLPDVNASGNVTRGNKKPDEAGALIRFIRGNGE